MPAKGELPSLALRPANDPDAGLIDDQEPVREDVVDLWQMYSRLSPEKRDQFLAAATKWQEAMIHWNDRHTLSFALMFVACEALKPPENQFRGSDAYDVIEGLLGRPALDEVRQHPVPAAWVRNTHLHMGELHGSELMRMALMSSTYQDPRFDEARRAFARLTPDVIIEWLRRGGTFTMPTREPRRSWRRIVKNHALTVIPATALLGFIVGWAIGTLGSP